MKNLLLIMFRSIILLVVVSKFIYSQNIIDSITVTDKTGLILSINKDDWNYEKYHYYEVGNTVPKLPSSVLPSSFSLFPPYPNPAPDSITFFFQTPMTSQISLVLYKSNNDSLVILNKILPAGYHNVILNDFSDLQRNTLLKCVFKDQRGYIFTKGNILIDNTVGVDNKTDIIPNFILLQNYPNPFNPSTTIEYTIDKPNDVRIVIYDMLGIEVKTIVNEFKYPGNYRVLFNASNLSSGIYFYQLINGNNIKTKSMILLK